MQPLNTDTDVYYDPYDVGINADPYPVFKRLREEAPLYYNEQYDFYAVSRYDDVERGLKDRDTFISGRGGILEIIKANIEMPPGIVIFEDPPTHTIYRSLLSRMFTPRKVAALEPKIREYCADALDPLVGSGQFDLIADFGAQMPMRVIGMLMGIPEQDQDGIRKRSDASLRTEAGKPMAKTDSIALGEMYADYIDWRIEHPSDDIMTDLLTVEFEDETGVRRRLTRDEVKTYVSVVTGAGNETTTRLIGWAGKVLAEHPDQRAEIVRDRSLVNAAIEEILRFEPPAPHVARYVAHDAEFHGRTVPEGSAIVSLIGAANRDESRFENGESFDIHRPPHAHLTFGVGAHFCLGAALARLEGRIALDEFLNRFPEWDVDMSGEDRADLDRARLGDLAGRGAVTTPSGLQVEIDRDICMGSGNCLHWAPGVFELDGDEIAFVVDTAAAPEDKILLAAQRCPTGAITVVRDGEKLI